MRTYLAMLGVGVLLLGGCGAADPTTASTADRGIPTTAEPSPPSTTVSTTSSTAPPTTAVDRSPVSGGSVVIADDQEPPTLNPLVPGGDNFIVSIIGQTHLAGVYDIDATTLQLVPELVAQLPAVSNGGVTVNNDGTMTVRYQIRGEAVWSDGVPISGDDFGFTLDLMLRPESPVDRTTYLDIVDWSAGPKTFEYTLRRPTLRYEQLFPVLVPKHAVEGSDFATDWNEQPWPSAGPFLFDEWQRGGYLRMVRNPLYWKADPATGAQLPYLDEVEFRFIPETEGLVNAFAQRDVDVIQPPPAPQTIDRLEALQAEGAEVQVRAGPVWEHLNFQFGPTNRNPESLNAYLPFRQAVAHAIDREALAPLVGWIPITSMLDPGGEGGPWAQYTSDPDRARALLAQACELDSRDCASNPPRMIFSTTSNAEERPRIAEELEVVLGEIGIAVELELEDSQLFFGETLDNGTWDVGWWAWVASPGAVGFISLLDVVDPESAPPDGTNYYRWGTPDSSVQDESVDEFRNVLAAARTAIDPAEVQALARDAEQILADNAVLIPVAARRVVGAVWADEIAGFEMNPSQASHTWNIELWHRTDL